jgi:hypothetical protein
MRGLQIVSIASALFLMISTAAYAAAPNPAAPSISDTPAKDFEDFNPNNFDHPTQIDNPWLPFTPGRQLTYEGFTVEDDGSLLPHRVVRSATDMTKVINGIRTVVGWDADYSDGVLKESELVFRAQDNDGNVWHFGEYPEVYEEGTITPNQVWLHGFEEAHAGIAMWANPQVGTPSYSEGWAPAVDWTDRGKIDQVGQKTCVPAGCYDDVLVTAESSRTEPNAEQVKYYARGVGYVRIGWRGTGPQSKETLELTSVKLLSADELAQVRATALALEQRSYQNSPTVFALTTPIELPPGVSRPAIPGDGRAPGMPRTGGAAYRVDPWATIVLMLGLLGVAGGMALRRRTGLR